jgi:hypothetical protein
MSDTVSVAVVSLTSSTVYLSVMLCVHCAVLWAIQAQCEARLTELFTVRELALAREGRLLSSPATTATDSGATDATGDATAVLLQPGQWLPQSEQVRRSSNVFAQACLYLQSATEQMWSDASSTLHAAHEPYMISKPALAQH